MRPLPLLAAASLLLTLLPFVPTAAAVPSGACPILFTSEVPAQSCTFVCFPGQRLYVFADTTASGFQWPRLRATCGGAEAVCQAQGGCTAYSPDAATSQGIGLCIAETLYVRGFCATDGPPEAPATWAAGFALATGQEVAWDAYATAVGLANGAVALALDSDRDGFQVHTEVQGNSDPTNAASKPTNDDDGDGLQNKDERSRAHALTGAVGNPAVRTGTLDRATFHFGHAGARATLRSPEGYAMTMVYLPPPGASPGCPPTITVSVPDLSPCSPPVVATFRLDGVLVGARRADAPSVAVPASSFLVHCTPRVGVPGACLGNVGADGTWHVAPATQAPRASLQPRLPAGFELSIQGKTFNDVAPDGGDIATTGTGQSSRDALMPLRLWNWHHQPAGSTYQACSGGLAAPCLFESPPPEGLLESRLYL